MPESHKPDHGEGAEPQHWFEGWCTLTRTVDHPLSLTTAYPSTFHNGESTKSTLFPSSRVLYRADVADWASLRIGDSTPKPLTGFFDIVTFQCYRVKTDIASRSFRGSNRRLAT